MEVARKGKISQYKSISNTLFVTKPTASVNFRQYSKQSKDLSPIKNTVKTKHYTQLKSNTISGLQLAINTLYKKPNQYLSQQKHLPTIKSYRNSERKISVRPQFTYGKKRNKNEQINTEASEKIKPKNEIIKTDQSRKRKFKSLDLRKQIDDQEGDLIVCANDNIGNRYQVLSAIGRGTFGQVFKAYDHKLKQYVALKIIKNDQKFTVQARVEVKILKTINQLDVKKRSNVIEIKDSFIYHNHMCISFELLHISLYEFLKQHNFKGFSSDLIRRIAIQVLQSLLFMQNKEIVHCDLKPQNILLKQPNKSGIKVIDMGSSCFISQRIYNYIQSRFYRAPQIILGIPYTCAIDMWSFGCILAELSSGQALFPGQNQMQQMDLFVEILGYPPTKVIEFAPRKRKFYEGDIFKGKRKPNSIKIKQIVGSDDKDLIDLISRCLQWDADKRIKPAQALISKFIIDSLPQDLRIHHLNQIKSEYPHLF